LHNNVFLQKKIIIVTIGLITIAIIVLLGVVQILFSTYSIARDPQLTVLEAGFENLKPRLVFRRSFFRLVALFVLFDIELILFFPGMLYLVNLNYLKVKC